MRPTRRKYTPANAPVLQSRRCIFHAVGASGLTKFNNFKVRLIWMLDEDAANTFGNIESVPWHVTPSGIVAIYMQFWVFSRQWRPCQCIPACLLLILRVGNVRQAWSCNVPRCTVHQQQLSSITSDNDNDNDGNHGRLQMKVPKLDTVEGHWQLNMVVHLLCLVLD